MTLLIMKTASLGLLEVPVVRVNAGGDAPRTPPLLVTSDQCHLSLFSSRTVFLANERENIFGGLTVKVITRNPNKQTAGLVPLVCT